MNESIKTIFDNIKHAVVEFFKEMRVVWSRHDYRLHRIAGCCISLVFGGTLNVFLGVALAAIIGVLKEYYDKCGYGTPEVEDSIMTIIGGIFAMALSMPLHYLIWGSIL